ncbi:MAG: sigma 54-interacting transcriptional regulator [Hyphomicrobiales bacterium]|nr:sigma 54-interacting transcriptional regulator [Hyphomicrobiales bacterium]
MVEPLEGDFRHEHHDAPEFADIVAVTLEMQRARTLAQRAADLDLPVLLEGEPGTGKRLIARHIHNASIQSSGPFRVQRFSASENEPRPAGTRRETIPLDKAWTEARGGTLFLDNVTEMSIDEQNTLKTLLQHQTPGASPLSERVRLLCASSRNLVEMVKNGQFDERLYYLISVFPIWLPPLRSRTDDIPVLAKTILSQIVAEFGKPVETIHPQAQQLLRNYSWPGNVRQLENAIFRAVALAEGYELTLKEFPQITAQIPEYRPPQGELPDNNLVDQPFRQKYEGPAMVGGSAPSDRAVSLTPIDSNGRVGVPATNEDGEFRRLEEIEADIIRLALGHYRGHITEIARRLGIGRSTLYRKMREFGLTQRHN